MTDRKKRKSIGDRLEQRAPAIFGASLKVEKETGVKKEEIKGVLEIKEPRLLSVEEQKQIVNDWIASKPDSMPNTISRIIYPSMYGPTAPRESLLDQDFVLSVSNNFKHSHKNPYWLLVKKNQEEYIDNWLQEEILYTDEIEEIICFRGFTLDPIYYKKIADRILEKGGAVPLFDFQYIYLEKLIEKGNLPISYREGIFLASSNGGWEHGSLAKDQAEKVLDLLTRRNLKKEYYKMFINHVIKSDRNKYMDIYHILNFVQRAIEYGCLYKDYHQEAMLKLFDFKVINSSTLSEKETNQFIEALLTKGFDSRFYEKIIYIIINDRLLLSWLYDSITFKNLCAVIDFQLRKGEYIRIVDICVNDFLQGKVKEIDTSHIKIALDAVKQGKLPQEYYDKVMKAGMELLVTS